MMAAEPIIVMTRKTAVRASKILGFIQVSWYWLRWLRRILTLTTGAAGQI
jgi:hypothetical protein